MIVLLTPRALRAVLAWGTFLPLAWLSLVVPAQGQALAAASERSVKAAFVYKFLGYVEWPDNAFASGDAPIVVGVIGADDVAAELADIVRGRSVNNRPVEVRRLHAGDPVIGVNVLFVGAAEHARLPQIMRAAAARNVLTITEVDDGLDLGTVINFVLVDGRVRFEVSLDAAERAGVRLSSRLLSVAHLVRMGSR